MHHRHTFAFGATLLALAAVLALASSALAGGAGPKVTVRIEGTSKTLLSARAVRPSAALVKKGGHSCSSDSGAGALNSATKGSWSGGWSSSLKDWEVTKILGETDNYRTTHSYWEVFVDNVAASTGICGVTPLRSGEQILLAAVGASESPADPLGLDLPRTAQAGNAFSAKVVYYDAKGQPKALAGATVTVAGHTFRTSSAGTVSLTASSAGTFTVVAGKTGYIRTEATLKVG